jgi:hypothetical protein
MIGALTSAGPGIVDVPYRPQASRCVKVDVGLLKKPEFNYRLLYC